MIETLTGWLSAPDNHHRRIAAVGLHSAAPNGATAIPALIKLLNEDHDETRIAATFGLMGFGALAADAIPALTKNLDHADIHTQYWTCRVLGKHGWPTSQPALPALHQYVETPL